MKKFNFFSFFLVIFIFEKLNAQELITYKLKINNFSNHNLNNIELPFWDDFSKSKSIDDSLWSNSDNIIIKDYYNINAPSKNVIQFDGIDINGNPYDHDEGYGISDIITSDIINLNNLIQADSTYFSFYWRFNINGESPDYEDSLFIDFLDDENKWQTIWHQNGGKNNNENQFIFEDIILDQIFFHKNFQFKIYNKGNTKGPFDSWLIDYIYLNKKRKKNDSTFLDRSLAHEGYKIFKNHISIPLDHINFSDDFSDSISFQINNLDKDIQPINYTFKAELPYNNKSYIISENKPLNPILNGYDRRYIKTSPIKLTEFELDTNSSEINFLFYISSGDSILYNQNFLKNDSSKFSINFSNFYSYDDGIAEFAAGLNQKNSELVVEHNTFTKDTLTHIQIYFPFNIYSEYNNQIEIIVYDNLDENNIKLTSQYITPNFNDSYNEYELASPIIVSDTFFIGFKQNENSFLPIGLDKNNNTSDKIFYKIDNSWIKNDLIFGSLMIRPVFGKSEYILTNTNSEKLDKRVNIFPNPSTGIFYLSKKVENIKIFNLEGKLLKNINDSDKINLFNYENGFYIVDILNSNIIERNKIIKRKY